MAKSPPLINLQECAGAPSQDPIFHDWGFGCQSVVLTCTYTQLTVGGSFLVLELNMSDSSDDEFNSHICPEKSEMVIPTNFLNAQGIMLIVLLLR